MGASGRSLDGAAQGPAHDLADGDPGHGAVHALCLENGRKYGPRLYHCHGIVRGGPGGFRRCVDALTVRFGGFSKRSFPPRLSPKYI